MNSIKRDLNHVIYLVIQAITLIFTVLIIMFILNNFGDKVSYLICIVLLLSHISTLFFTLRYYKRIFQSYKVIKVLLYIAVITTMLLSFEEIITCSTALVITALLYFTYSLASKIYSLLKKLTKIDIKDEEE